MLKLKPDKDALFERLCSDCITYGLKPKEAQEYVKLHLGRRMSVSAINQRKARILSDEGTQTWINNFTRIGFIKLQREQFDNIQKVLDNTNRWYFEELVKPSKNASLLLRLHNDIRESTSLLISIGLGTPILAETRERIRRKEHEHN